MFRRMNPTQGVLTVGKSKARIVGEEGTGVTFGDVAGVDEARVELQEVVEFLKTPDKFAKLGAKIPKGVLLVGPPGNGQDAAGARGGRRGGGDVLLHLRRRVRGDVRGRGRGAGARPVRAGQGAGALHHLHRRAGRAGQGAHAGRHPGRQRRARADAEPAAGGDGRLRPAHRRHHHGGHQPAGDPGPGAAAGGALRPAGAGGPARLAGAAGDPEDPRQGDHAGAGT